MPFAPSGDISLYYEETGTGTPLLFVHEFVNDYRGWEQQVRYFSRYYRCITFNARGFPPSDVPKDPDQYGLDRAVGDIEAVLDHLGIEKAFVCGFSMGAATSLYFSIRHPQRVLGLVFFGGGTGSGADPAARANFAAACELNAQTFLEEGMSGPTIQASLRGPTRVELLHKDPRSWAEMGKHFAEHSALGSALNMRRYLAVRPSPFDLEDDLRQLRVPILIIAGDQDAPVLESAFYLKKTLPAAGLLIVPNTGHSVNLEEPAFFNAAVDDFLKKVERGRWPLPAAAPPA